MRDGQNQYETIASFEDTPRDRARPRAFEPEASVQRVEAKYCRARPGDGDGKASPCAGKLTSLAVSPGGPPRRGYKVEGFAPTSRAAQKLAEAGIESRTLQRIWTRKRRAQAEKKKTALRSRRIEFGEHEADERVPPSAQGRRRVTAVGDTAAA